MGDAPCRMASHISNVDFSLPEEKLNLMTHAVTVLFVRFVAMKLGGSTPGFINSIRNHDCWLAGDCALRIDGRYTPATKTNKNAAALFMKTSATGNNTCLSVPAYFSAQSVWRALRD